MPIEQICHKDFDNKVLKGPGIILVAFHAEWCPFCKKFIPLFREFQAPPAIILKEALVNEDENPLWTRFKIETIPTLIAFKGGKIIGRRDALPGVGLTREILTSIITEINHA